MRVNLTIGFIILSLSVASGASAQSSAVQNALKNVQGQVQDLVTVKDEGGNDLNLRIETFKKVIDFSISEAKDLKIKLLGLEKLSKETELWRDDVVKTLNAAFDYYEFQKQQIEDAPRVDLDMIKKMAGNFKEWREKNYITAADIANSYLLITQEQKAVEVAGTRWQRIEKDVTTLQKAKIKNAARLKEMLDKAGKIITSAAETNKRAGELFWNNYILPYALTVTENETTTTSTAPSVIAPALVAATSSTSTEVTATSPTFQPSSIKDLVESSLNQIKEAYQIFIEMSNLVRKLLS